MMNIVSIILVCGLLLVDIFTYYKVPPRTLCVPTPAPKLGLRPQDPPTAPRHHLRGATITIAPTTL